LAPLKLASVLQIAVPVCLMGALALPALCAPPKGAAKGPSAANAAAGKKVYEQNRCAACHSINGTGGKAGPDLSSEGSNTAHSVAWLQAEIKNPKSHKPDSKMPSYEASIKGKELSSLATYLSSLKKKK